MDKCAVLFCLQVHHYRYLDGMEALLQTLRAQRQTMHIMSNYPLWYREIERKLQLSQYLDWTFISCDGPMKVRGAALLEQIGDKEDGKLTFM